MARPNIGDRFGIGAVGNAETKHVLENKTFSSEEVGTGATGTMDDHGPASSTTENLISNNQEYTILEGFHSGYRKVKAVITDLIAGNIRFGATVGGVSGSYSEAPVGEVPEPDDLLKNKSAFIRGGSKISGNMENNTGHVTGQSHSRDGTTLRFRPQKGYYPGDAGNSVQMADGNFIAGNIRDGVEVFGLLGDYDPDAPDPVGNAAVGDVLHGQTFSSEVAGVGVTGTMDNNTGHISAHSYSISTNTLRFRPVAGYYPGGSTNSIGVTDSNWIQSNIKHNVSIFDKTGTFTSTGSAPTASQLLQDRVAFANGNQINGSMANNTGHVTGVGTSINGNFLRFQPVAGFYPGGGANSVQIEDSNWVLANIKHNVNIFGKTGNFTSTGSAPTASQLLEGRVAFANGNQINGSMENKGAISETLTNQGQSVDIDEGYHNGDGSVTANITNLSAGNVKNGTVVGGVTGTFPNDGNALVGEVLADKTFYSDNATKRTGTMENQTGHVTAKGSAVSGNYLRFQPEDGFYPGDAGNSVQYEDNNWLPENIKESVEIFGKEGTRVKGITSVNGTKYEIELSQEGTGMKLEYTLM